MFTIAHATSGDAGRVMDWLAGHALNLMPAGATHFVLHGHEHEFGIRSTKTRTAIAGSPTFDGGSTWFHRTHWRTVTPGCPRIHHRRLAARQPHRGLTTARPPLILSRKDPHRD
ncbi:hypothetical protein GS498_20165 [Rhodococcus hoagii]|nr:hypothetical protein [Prescottella equi]